MQFRSRFLSAVVAVAVSAPAFASDPAQGLYQQAQQAFANRQSLAENERAITLLQQAEGLVRDESLKYDILILASRAYYWKGGHTQGDNAKMAIYDQGMAKASAAKVVNDDFAEAHYFYGINLGKWALAKGVTASLGRKKELIQNAEGAIERETRDGQPGETLDGYGPNRVLGRMYFKLPGFAGGSQDKSLRYLEAGYKNAKNVALNVVYYAETLNNGSGAEKALARRILDEMLAQDPLKYNTDRTPETLEEFEEGRQLRKEMGR